MVIKQSNLSTDGAGCQAVETAQLIVAEHPPLEGYATVDRYLVEGWMPAGHRVMDPAPEGGFKTMFGAWLTVRIASGNPFLGQSVEQGPVVIVDEETPEEDLLNHLQRFALGSGFRDWRELPITVLSMKGFRFGRETELNRLLGVVAKEKPVLVRVDSLLACLPGGRQGMGENNAETGIAVRDDLGKILKEQPAGGSIMMSAHSGKPIAMWSLKQLKEASMQALVRGHGGIVGQACDTGIPLKKISEYPEATRFVAITKARRRAVPIVAQDVYVELKEVEYGKGPARLERIAPVVIPPSKIAQDLFAVFPPGETVEAAKIVRKAALYTKGDVREGVEELLDRKVIVKAGAFTYQRNPQLDAEVEDSYLGKLKASLA